MLGVFQGETVRVELEASREILYRYLVDPTELRQWIWPQELDPSLSEPLQRGTMFYSYLGSIQFGHRVESLDPMGQMQVLLWGGADGFCQWSWGNGWVQLRIEAVSLLPLSLGQLILLQRLRQYAQLQSVGKVSTGEIG